MTSIRKQLLPLLLLLSSPSFLGAYSVLTHEAIIDTTWKDSIEPVLLARFPSASEQELLKAHSFAYGGCIVQDMGYYPFGSKFFSDLLHYVRSGDFVRALIREAQDLNEYAFALGALAHYTADDTGHPIGVNVSVALLYPDLRAEYGSRVTYEANPAAHIKVEFGFDVLEVAAGRYAPKAYHDFIGFEVATRVLESAFRDTYGLEMKDVFHTVDLAIGTYRRTVSMLLPRVTEVAWELKKDELAKAQPAVTRDQFLYGLSTAGYEKEWGHTYQKPGVFSKILAFLVRILPKVGPLRVIEFRPPTPETAKLFIASSNATLDRYRDLLRHLRAAPSPLPNRNLDTGKPTLPGTYRLCDDTYAKLVRMLAKKGFASASPEIRQDLLAFFGDANRPLATKRHKREWHDTEIAVRALKAGSRKNF